MNFNIVVLNAQGMKNIKNNIAENEQIMCEIAIKEKCFIFTDKITGKHSTITHNPNVVKNLSKKAREILGVGTLGGSNGDGNSDSPLNKPIIFEATRETD